MYLQRSRRQANKTENDSTCYECNAGGEVVCCDGCPRSYHLDCVSRETEPRRGAEKWYCPDCQDQAADVLDKLGPLDWYADASTTSDNEPDPPRPPRRERSALGNESSWDSSGKMNVGAGFQVPGLPAFFLEAQEHGVTYEPRQGGCMLTYSPSLLARHWAHLTEEERVKKRKQGDV